MIKTVVRYFLKPKDGRSPYIGENGNWFEWDDPQQKYIDTGRPARGETGKDGTNYLILGWWDDKISYMLSDLGIPVVKVADGTSLGYSAYSLDTGVSTPGASPSGAGSSEWRLVESAEFIYMQDAYIERLQFESALGGGFEIVDGQFQSIAKDTNGVRLMGFDGLTGGGHLAGGNIRWNSQGGAVFMGGIVNPFVQVNDALIQPNSDNLPCNIYAFYRGITTSPAYYYTLPCEKELSGLVIRIHNIQGGRSGPMTINAPQSNAFYENGTVKSNLDLEFGHAIELICVADNVRFHSWDFIRRYQCRPYNN